MGSDPQPTAARAKLLSPHRNRRPPGSPRSLPRPPTRRLATQLLSLVSVSVYCSTLVPSCDVGRQRIDAVHHRLYPSASTASAPRSPSSQSILLLQTFVKRCQIEPWRSTILHGSCSRSPAPAVYNDMCRQQIATEPLVLPSMRVPSSKPPAKSLQFSWALATLPRTGASEVYCIAAYSGSARLVMCITRIGPEYHFMRF